MNRRSALTAAAATVVGIGGYAWWTRNRVAAPPEPKPSLLWAFEAPIPGGLVAAPLVTPHAVYQPAVHIRGLGLGGAVYALDPQSGKRLWSYDHDGEMLPSASSPAAGQDLLILGEGMHSHFACRLHAIHAESGRRVWTFPTTDHIECGPLVVDDTVYFTAGNDGLYALHLRTGRPIWQYKDRFHSDSTPAIANELLVIGTGPSRRYRSTEVIAVDRHAGVPRWRTPVPLPAWSSPVVRDGRVSVGLGNGRLMIPAQPPERPAGGLTCFDAEDGTPVWHVTAGDAVFARPLFHERRLFVGSRDGWLYAVDAETGREQYRVPFDGPVMTDAATDGVSVFAASANGRVCAVDPVTGRMRWKLELGELANATVQVYAPLRYSTGRLFVGAEVKAANAAGIATLFCLSVPPVSDTTRNPTHPTATS